MGYNTDNFKFRISHGSGHYQISLNNSELAAVQERDGNVTIRPKKEGSLEIKVVDIEIPDSEPTYAELLISDIAKLEVDSFGTLIEQHSKMELNITAYDNHGDEFDEDQY